MRISYNNIDKPKNYAKNLKKYLKVCEKDFSLTDCQKMISIMSGYNDWKELKNQIGKAEKFIPENISAINFNVWQKEFDKNLIFDLMRFYARNMTYLNINTNLCHEAMLKIFPDNYCNKPLILIGSIPGLSSNLNPMKTIISILKKFYQNPSTICIEHEEIEFFSRQKKDNFSEMVSNISMHDTNIVYFPSSINSDYVAKQVNKIKSDRILVKTHGNNAKDVLKRWIRLTYQDENSIPNNISKVIYYSVVDNQLVYECLDLENKNVKDVINC